MHFLPELLAVISAMMYALSSVLIKLGLNFSNSHSGVLISIITNVISLWVVAIFFLPLALLFSPYILIFVAAGILAPGIARMLRYVSLERIGVSRTAPLTATSPVYASLFAVFFLKEEITAAIIIGTILIIFGVIFISRGSLKIQKEDMIFALIAAFITGIAAPIRKLGLNYLNYPLLAAVVTATAAMAVAVSILYYRGNIRKCRFDKGTKFYAVSGLLISAALLFNFAALSAGNVSVVVPLLTTYPLFAIFFSHLFLSHVEKIDSKVWIGAVVIVAGAVMLSVF